MFTGGGYDERVDMWAAGITLYKLITGRTPFESEYRSATIENIIRCEPSFDETVWKDLSPCAKKLVKQLLKNR